MRNPRRSAPAGLPRLLQPRIGHPRLVRDHTVCAGVAEGIGVVDASLEGDVVASMRVEPAGR